MTGGPFKLVGEGMGQSLLVPGRNMSGVWGRDPTMRYRNMYVCPIR